MPKGRSPDKGTRLPDDWQADEADRAYARLHGFSDAEIDRIVLDFRDFWTCKSGASALHRLWPRVFQRWVRVEADRRPRGNITRFPARETGYERSGREYLESLEQLKTG